jgi:hypothetical protein
LCRETAAISKEYNVRRHFETKQPEVAKLDVHGKKIKAANFVKRLSAEQQIFKKVNTENVASSKVNFGIWREIVAAGRSFTEGDFTKKCMLIAVSRLRRCIAHDCTEDNGHFRPS